MSAKTTIVKSTTAVIAVMLCSRLLGFLRQTVIAAVYGADLSTDIYFISSDFMITVAGAFTAALTTALVTVYIAVAVKEDKLRAGEVAAKVMTVFLMAAAALLLLFIVFAPQISHVLAPAYNDGQINELAHYLRIFSVTFIFSAVQSNYAAVLNANNIFVPGKLYGIIFNPIAIFFVLVIGEKIGIAALVYAYYIANIIMMVILGIRCKKLYRFRPTLKLKDKNLYQVGKLALPILISNLLIQLNGIIDKAICSFLGEGVASSYTYARTLEQFVTGTFTVTVTLVLLSRFAAFVVSRDEENLQKLLRNSLSAMVLILSPIALITIFAANDIVSLIYFRGEFTGADVTITSLALIGFAVGFPLVALRDLLNQFHFAHQKATITMVINVFAVGLNAILSIILQRWFGILGVTVATSLSVIISIILLNASAKRYLPDFRFFASWRTYLKCLAALAICAGAILCVSEFCTDSDPLLRTSLKLLFGCGGYLLTLFLLRCKELNIAVDFVKAKLRR